MKLLLNLHAHPLQMPVEETKYSYGMLKDILTNNFKLVNTSFSQILMNLTM